MGSSEHYRKLAKQALSHAFQISDAQDRTAMREIARRYQLLAELVEEAEQAHRDHGGVASPTSADTNGQGANE